MLPDLSVVDAFVPLLARTLLHFVWQGLLIWAVASVLVDLLGRYGARARYAILACMLGLLAVCPVMTFAVLAFDGSASQTVSQPVGYGAGPGAIKAPPPVDEPLEVAAEAALARRLLSAWLERYQYPLVAAWLCGLTWFFARTLFGGVGVRLLVRRSQPLADGHPLPIARLAQAVGLKTVPAVAAVSDLTQAMAVGVLRPMVLLPASWLSELPPDVLEAVLAHELAHVRRYDVAVNFVQRLVEAALFYHPAVWWCSRRLRVEREMCCDQLALAAIGSPADYAKALALLADRRLLPQAALLAAGIGGASMPLLDRVQNVLGIAPGGERRLRAAGPYLVGGVLASFVWVAALLVARQWPEGSPPDPGFDVPPQVSLHTVNGVDVANEAAMQTLPPYTIEPPDVLLIEVPRVVPKAPYKIQSQDVLRVQLEGGFPDRGNVPDQKYTVDGSGRIDLGPLYGKVHVAGLTDDEATEAVRKSLAHVLKDPQVSVQFVQTTGLQVVAGEHLVTPDGTINLGSYGSVQVGGMKIEAARAAVTEHLSRFLDAPQVQLSVFAYNSKVAYVIVEGQGQGDSIARFPITGNETLLDVLSQANDLGNLNRKKIWIARPTLGSNAKDLILPVNWQEITRGGSPRSNYQIFPGDRIFIVGK